MPHYLNIDKLGSLVPEALDLRLRGFSGYEELSRLYQFRLDLDLPLEQASILDVSRIVGQPIVFSVNGAESNPSFYSGLVSSLSLGQALDNDRRSIHLQVVPELWKLTQMLNTKRFDSLTVSGIADQLVTNFALRLNLVNNTSSSASDHPDRFEPVQYDESPFHFLARLLAEESVFFYFLNPFQDAAGAIARNTDLVIGDAPGGYTPLQNLLGTTSLEMRFHPTSSVQTMDMVFDWARQYQFRPAEWTIQDHDYEKTRDFNMLKSSIGSNKSDAAPYKKFKKSAGFKETNFATRQLDRLGERERAQSEFIRGAGYCHYFHPGIQFRFSDHDFATENGDYVVTSVEHHASETMVDGQPVQAYQNRFTCLPADRLVVECPYGTSQPVSGAVQLSGFGAEAAAFSLSPTQANSPTTPGTPPQSPIGQTSGPARSTQPVREPRSPEIAYVCDPTGDYSPDSSHYGTVQTDSNDGFGRVLIRFPWEDDDAYQANRWVRVAQSTAGKDWGGKFLPRVGDEVVVMYIDGMEQRPMIVGTVYNDVHSLKNQQESKIHKLQSEETNPFATDGSGEISLASTGTEQIAQTSSATDNNNEAQVPSLQDPNVSGFRTRTNRLSSADDETSVGYNELLFNDSPSNQQIYIRAEKDLNIHVKNDLNIEVCGNKNEIIRGDYYRVANVGASPNGYVTDSARRYPANSDGGVARSISEGDNYDYDKVWEVWTVEAFSRGPATDRLGASHGPEHTSGVKPGTTPPKYYLVKTETYADQQFLNIGDVKEMFHGHFEEHFHGNKLEVVKGGMDGNPTIRTEIEGHTHETFDGKTDTYYKGDYVKTTFQSVDVEDYYLGSNTFSFHGGAKEEIMLGFALSIFLGGAIEAFIGNKLEMFAGNLVSLHAGSKIEIAPDSNKINAKWTSYATSFGITALSVKMNGIVTLN